MNTRNTANFIKDITLLALDSDGWETSVENGYIFASKAEEAHDLIICCAARCLSQGDFKETKMINAPFGKVNKMINYLAASDDDCIPCIAFGIIKYSVDEFEVALVPVSAIEDLAQRGSVYSITETGGYYYNYSKLGSGELPPRAILRKEWSTKNNF